MNNSVPQSAAHVNEFLLLKCLFYLFPNENILVNENKQHEFTYPDSGGRMEFDIWIPKFNLAFEFQDSYHYITTWYKRLPQQHLQMKDYYKLAAAMQNNIELICIPIWWDGTVHSLAATISYQLPGLLEDADLGAYIPLNPPRKFFTQPSIPTVQELMLASFATENFKVTPNAWWLGEKYDGVRCYWHFSTQTAYTRNGTELVIERSVKEKLPEINSDTEAWGGRGQYHTVGKLVYSPSISWDFFRLIVFDVIELHLPFEARYQMAMDHLDQEHAVGILAARVLCKSDAHAQFFSHCILGAEGEGAILRRVGSFYEIGRSLSLIKMKSVTDEKEAIVSRIESDGSIKLKLPSGVIFEVPQSDVHVKAKVGDIVTYSHEVHSRRDMPVRPIILKIRTDMKWDDLFASYQSAGLHYGESFKAKPLRHWTIANIRAFLEAYAESKGLDPLLPSTWYKISRKNLLRLEGGSGVLSSFKGGYHKNLSKIFPDINFDSYKTNKTRKVHRNFFINYAKKYGFDPLVPQNWYRQSKEQIIAEQGGRSVLRFHGGKAKALVAIFPNIGLSSSSFRETNHKEVFEKFASENGFDPLVSSNWGVSICKKAAHNKIIKPLLKVFYNNSMKQALSILFFPTILHQQSSWNTKQKQLAFFTSYAKARGFDPLVANNWYSQTRRQIYAAKGAKNVVMFYEQDYRKALLALFPNIGLDQELLYKNKRNVERTVNVWRASNWV